MAHKARKRFGQHFLIDSGVTDAILRSINANKNDVLVEIGPGQGALTDALAKQAGHLHAVELDRDLPLDLLSADLSRPCPDVDVGNLLERHPGGRAPVDRR